ncbi:MAG: WHG domain-containing protein [Kineosporiaceae bacterium]|nr:WHG domain-containing protein [Kineosporiaceae bacterium]
MATAAVDGFRRVALAHPALYRLVFLDQGPDAGALRRESGAEAFGRLETLLHRALADARGGEGGTRRAIPSATVRQAALAVHSLTEGLATVDLRGGLGADRAARAVWRSAVTALVRGYAAAASDRARQPPG